MLYEAEEARIQGNASRVAQMKGVPVRAAGKKKRRPNRARERGAGSTKRDEHELLMSFSLPLYSRILKNARVFVRNGAQFWKNSKNQECGDKQVELEKC